ncbi:MAG: hypothetical protein JJU36_15600 [Phycisphaeraceae bacterium]|nr:hypothetical protein [Phycisphaeraceae bacterium]
MAKTPNPTQSRPSRERIVQMAGEVAQSVSILNVRLVASQTSLGKPPTPGTRKSLRARHRVRGDTHPEPSILRVLVDLVLEESPNPGGSGQAASGTQEETADRASAQAGSQQAWVPAGRLLIGATFQLVYQLPEIDKYGKDQLQAFAEVNAVYNVWPYWREYVQSTLARMGLPTITMPAYRIG